MLQDELITNNIKKIKEGLTDCKYIIDRYDCEELYDVNPETHRRRLVDYKITVFPTKNFQYEQYRVNVHHKNIEGYRLDTAGRAITKPLRDQYQ